MFDTGKTPEDKAIEDAQADYNTAIQNREQAYKLESDGLFISWQYDKTEESEQIWRGKVKEIKERFPLS